jgi:tripartite-type tricarboxylate transporter receptor subunit TctC
MKLLNVIARAAVACAVCVGAAHAQWHPDRTVKILVPFAPAASADGTFRAISDKLGAALGQPVVVDNRPGAGGMLGTQVGAKSAPDGYTLIGGSDPPFTINPHLGKVPYDPLKDFVPVSLIVEVPLFLVVRPDVSANNVRELIALANSQPGKLTIGSSGNGSSGHLAAELLKKRANINLLHVPYKGQAQAVLDVLAGRVDMTFSSLGPVTEHIRAGKLKLLAISTGKRVAVMPNVPTVAESGVADFDLGVWIGLLYPAGTPAAAVQRVNAEVDKILRQPDVKAKFEEIGYVVVGGPPERLAQRINGDYAMFGKLIQDAKITSGE